MYKISDRIYNTYNLFGFFKLSLLSFKDPYQGNLGVSYIDQYQEHLDQNKNLFWALSLKTSYSSLHAGLELLRCIEPTQELIYKHQDNSKETTNNRSQNYNKTNSLRFSKQQIEQKSCLMMPYIKLQQFPCSSFTSFFHLARLENIYYDFFKKKGAIFLLGESFSSGQVGLIVQSPGRAEK